MNDHNIVKIKIIMIGTSKNNPLNCIIDQTIYPHKCCNRFLLEHKKWIHNSSFY